MVSEKEMLQICRWSGKAAEITVTGRDESKKTNRMSSVCIKQINIFFFSHGPDLGHKEPSASVDAYCLPRRSLQKTFI